MRKENKKIVSKEIIKERRKKISKLIEAAIIDVQEEINLHKAGKGIDATIPILLQIEEELYEMKNSMSPKKFNPTYNYIIRDSWNTYSKLGEELLKVVHEYNEKLE